MKIALDIRKIGRQATGDEVYIANLIRNLANIDHENQYFLCSDSQEHAAKAAKTVNGLPSNFRFVPLSPRGKLFWTKYSLPRFLKKERIDVAHVQYIAPSRMPKGTSLITTIHDVSFARYPEFIQWLDRMILKALIPGSIRKADRIIAVSKFTKDEIVEIYKVPEKKVRVIYNGVNAGRFMPRSSFSKDMLDRLKTKFGLTGRYIFHVSSLQARKNVPSLIDAFREYTARYGDDETLLVIAGGKGYNYDSRIEACLRDLKMQRRVKMIGYVKDEELPLLYAMADIYVSPSMYEGFDLPLVEAMKSEVPLIASDASCHQEIVGAAGRLIDVHDSKAFSTALHECLSNEALRARLIEEGRKRASVFSWKKCAEETLALYRELGSAR